MLALWEVQRYGSDSFRDPDYVSVYGLAPEEWYSLGIRLLARTAVECTRDRLADLIGRDIAVLADAAQMVSGSVVVDPFAGSGNTLYWIQRHLLDCRGVGFGWTRQCSRPSAAISPCSDWASSCFTKTTKPA